MKMQLGDLTYAFRWLQQGYIEETTSKRRFDTVEEVKDLCQRLNDAWGAQLVHWPVTYEAQMKKSGKLGWAEVKSP